MDDVERSGPDAGRTASPVSSGLRREQLVQHLCASFDVIGRLPRAMLATGGGLVANACYESFLVHVRLLSSFLAGAGPGAEPTALDLLWPRPTSPAAHRLATRWGPAAQATILRLGPVQVPPDRSSPAVEHIDAVAVRMREMAEDAFEVAETLVRTLEGYGHPDGATLRRSLDFNRQALRSTPGARPHSAAS